MAAHSILWRRFDLPGHEVCRMMRTRSSLELDGVVVFGYRKGLCALSYSVDADGAGRTRRARVQGRVGRKAVDLKIECDRARRWKLNGRPCPDVEGCEDVDLNFSPSTNTLPILRLKLATGKSAPVSAAWLKFPDFKLRRLDQTYERLGRLRYRYTSSSGFTAPMEVNRAGLVTKYGNIWKAVRKS
ncbi:MAG TPA: putative glycolipid-binding domain-containing protein [Planctomycetota bacterium]|nr:putative glycolipid-binding domain-containing protein [Planctomycetota bacterium]